MTVISDGELQAMRRMQRDRVRDVPAVHLQMVTGWMVCGGRSGMEFETGKIENIMLAGIDNDVAKGAVKQR
jgi:hypothetical protein